MIKKLPIITISAISLATSMLVSQALAGPAFSKGKKVGLSSESTRSSNASSLNEELPNSSTSSEESTDTKGTEDTDQEESSCILNILDKAIWKKDVKSFLSIISKNPDLLSVKCDCHGSIAHFVAYRSNVEMMKELEKILPSEIFYQVAKPFQQKKSKKEFYTPLDVALNRAYLSSSASMQSWLINKIPADQLCQPDTFFPTPLFSLASAGHYDSLHIYKILLEKLPREQIYIKDSEGKNFLHHFANNIDLRHFPKDAINLIDPSAFTEWDNFGKVPSDYRPIIEECLDSDCG